MTLLKIAGFAILGAFIALAIAVGVTMASLPGFNELKSSPNGQMVRVRAADGSVLVALGPSYGEWLPYGAIPKNMVDAMVAVEDRRYYMHPGIDPIGMARGTYRAFINRGQGRRIEGASTITQQLARNIFLTSAYDFGRKAREILLALAMERKFTKQQILELYLNRVYFGGGSYGIDGASRKFFGHSASELSLAESAIIAGLVKAPSHYSPTADAQAAIGRAGVVLGLMVETGYISPSQAAAADPADVRLAPATAQNSVRYFTDWALAQLDALVDERSAPIDVWTTLDTGMQRAADAAIRGNTPDGAQGALVALDRDGGVKAMVGGKDYVSSIYNRATQAVRQPGSAFKLFVYLTALENGMKPSDGVVDQPVTIGGWSPRNSSGRFSGQMDLRTAFAFSINTVAAQIGQKVGFQAVADMARRFGISTPINVHPSMVLGSSDVRLIDMTRAFASVAARGVAVEPYGILKVTTPDGVILYEHQADNSRVLVAPYVADEMTDLLQTAVNTGTGRAAQIGRPVAGKTGTTTANKDGWFLGFSSGITTGVWMGRDDARAIPGLQGGRAPAQAFAAFMGPATSKRPVENFQTEVVLPDWQLEPDAEAYYGDPGSEGSGGGDYASDPIGGLIDGQGNPAGPPQGQGYPDGPPIAPPPPQGQPRDPQGRDPQGRDYGRDFQRDQDGARGQPQPLDQRWLDGVLGRDGPRR
ncbi:PBP1A family penicillin-binding protein [Sphingomonas naphthae]|uniref:peptidoglycan glycosyltransferase n=1 Tax=Sphingomonas naphthae TaxID=1813468 RepID=A0ABY7TLY2_9SPHN|nr:PBP1A family penicillin-binding protein [Sphingomonas naphthae]WCT73259.1 PBP1A family penicillin-binding protein [Sphingomonas naphthae]